MYVCTHTHTHSNNNLRSELLHGSRVAVQGACHDKLFLVLELNDALFDGVLYNEADGCDALCLADTVHTINGLELCGRIPPRVDYEDVVGILQVEPLPACLERNHDDARCVVAAKGVEIHVALLPRHVARDPRHPHAVAREADCQQVKHPRVLRKDDGLAAVPARHHCADLGCHGLQLGARRQLVCSNFAKQRLAGTLLARAEAGGLRAHVHTQRVSTCGASCHLRPPPPVLALASRLQGVLGHVRKKQLLHTGPVELVRTFRHHTHVPALTSLDPRLERCVANAAAGDGKRRQQA